MTKVHAIIGLAACTAFAVIAGAASSQGASPVAERQAAMKHVGQAMKESSAFLAPSTPYDAAKVKALMGGIAADAKKLHALYPAGSGADPKSAAGPKIWQNKADFDKRLTELGTLATTASQAGTADAFKPAFQAVGGTCKSCHDLYRIKKPS